MDQDLVNIAQRLASELRRQGKPNYKLYRTGNMMRSINVVAVNEEFIDVVIATDYASYTNTRGKWAGWVQQVTDRVVRAYVGGNNVENEAMTGMVANIYYGG